MSKKYGFVNGKAYIYGMKTREERILIKRNIEAERRAEILKAMNPQTVKLIDNLLNGGTKQLIDQLTK